MEVRSARGDGRALIHILRSVSDNEASVNCSDHRDNIATLLFTGFETCAKLLTWAWHLLSQNVSIVDLLAAEAKDAFQDGPITVDKTSRLSLSSAVIDETLRLYPPVWSFGRRARNADQIGMHSITAGSLIVISPYVTHRHPKHWRSPNTFDPNHFLPYPEGNRHQFAYFPFGAGKRSCIAENLARLQAKLAISLIARDFQINALSRRPIAPLPLTTLQPSEPILVRISEREQTALCSQGLSTPLG